MAYSEKTPTNKSIEVTCRFTRQFFPKGRKIDNEWGILVADIINIKKGEPNVDPMWGTITATGQFPDIIFNECEYILVADELIDDYGKYTYDVTYVTLAQNLTDVNNQKALLKHILKPKELEALYDMYDNPYELFVNKDINAVTKIKGIGIKKAEKIFDKFEDGQALAPIYEKLKDFDLTKNMVNKLLARYGSPDIVINKVTKNPYILVTEVEGIGFKKADDIAMKGGLIKPNSPHRIRAFIEYTLEAQAQEGNCWVNPVDLTQEIRNQLGVIDMLTLKDTIDKMYEDNTLYSNKPKPTEENPNPKATKIALMKYFKLECKIAREIIRLMKADNSDKFSYDGWGKIVDGMEMLQGWKHTLEQRKGIESVLSQNLTVVTGLGGCVDCDTEFFNGHEWKRMSEYKHGEKVLQYNLNGSASLVVPERYIKEPCEYLNLIKTDTGAINQCVSDEHNMVYISSKGNINKKNFLDFKKLHEGNKHGFNGKFITTFDYSGRGIDLTDDQIRVMVAVIADGHFHSQNSNLCRMNLKKERKKERLREILKNANIEFREKNKTTAEGYTEFYFQAPRIEKEYNKYWYKCKNSQLKIVADEALYWDGTINRGRKSFSTTIKASADFIQFAFSSCGFRASVTEADRTGQEYLTCDKIYTRKSKEYTVTITTQRTPSLVAKEQYEQIKIPRVPTKDGYKYCFTVPSGMLVLRREGRINITGNSGKSTITNAMSKVLFKYVIKQCCLAGKASQRMFEVNGLDSYTIHRLLGIDPITGQFIHNEQNKLELDILYIDEAGMIGGALFYSLLQAIPSTAKVVIIGDYGQLSAIGSCNVFYDLLHSECVPIVHLTEVHRQAKASAIISKSIDIRFNRQLFDAEFEGNMILGELQDLELEIKHDREELADITVKKFLKLLKEENNDIMAVQIVSAMRTRGNLSCYNLNTIIQSIINPIDEHKSNIKVKLEDDKYYTIQVGDRVINTKNTYEAFFPNGDKTSIFNGNVGIVTKIDEDSVYIDFQGFGEIILEPKQWKKLELAYAITCNKMQGGQSKKVVVALDYSAFKLLCCEWVYTAITRAEKYCVLVAENSALRYAISISKTPVKNTFLKELLKQMLYLMDKTGDEILNVVDGI